MENKTSVEPFFFLLCNIVMFCIFKGRGELFILKIANQVSGKNQISRDVALITRFRNSMCCFYHNETRGYFMLFPFI